MRLAQLVLTMLFAMNSFAVELSLPELRTLYLAAVESREKSEQFLNYMHSINHDDALMHAYYASALALVSKHASGPIEKMKYLKLADKAFEESVIKNPNDAEVRFLRFSVQFNLPKFLGYSDDMDADIIAMLQNINNTRSILDHPGWLAVIADYMINSGQCSDEQSAQFKALLK